ncbi:MAG: BRCT domain-containing protein [Pseudomonadota bacterium]
MRDYDAYRKFTAKSEMDKAINSLLGLVEGISIDARINKKEESFLENWLQSHSHVAHRHPFNELFPVITSAVADGILTQEEKEDIVWLGKNLLSTLYYDAVTADVQKLHAVLAGIAADGVISPDEMRGLSVWLEEHERLKGCWPYDEVESLILSILSDKKIEKDEHDFLVQFFRQFVAIFDDRTLVNPVMEDGKTLVGVCAVCPEIKFSGFTFCVTGSSHTYSRKEFEKIITDLGGVPSSTVTQSVDYLVIGADGNPCWVYACYGRKVEKAIELRKMGRKIIIVHENDFHDAVADLGIS